MGELLDGFIDQYDSEDGVLSLKELLTEEEIIEWELLVRVFSELEITSIGPNLKKINQFYKLKRWQEMSVLALVKMLEIMVGEAKDRMEMVEGKMKLNMDNLTSLDNTDGMFG